VTGPRRVLRVAVAARRSAESTANFGRRRLPMRWTQQLEFVTIGEALAAMAQVNPWCRALEGDAVSSPAANVAQPMWLAAAL
jgi:hypothetical protein